MREKESRAGSKRLDKRVKGRKNKANILASLISMDADVGHRCASPKCDFTMSNRTWTRRQDGRLWNLSPRFHRNTSSLLKALAFGQQEWFMQL